METWSIGLTSQYRIISAVCSSVPTLEKYVVLIDGLMHGENMSYASPEMFAAAFPQVGTADDFLKWMPNIAFREALRVSQEGCYDAYLASLVEHESRFDWSQKQSSNSWNSWLEIDKLARHAARHARLPDLY